METKTISYAGTFNCKSLHCYKCKHIVFCCNGFGHVCGLFNEYLDEVYTDKVKDEWDLERLGECLALPIVG